MLGSSWRMIFPMQRSLTSGLFAVDTGKVIRYSIASPTVTGASARNKTPEELMFRVSPVFPTDTDPLRTNSKGSLNSNLFDFRCSITSTSDADFIVKKT